MKIVTTLLLATPLFLAAPAASSAHAAAELVFTQDSVDALIAKGRALLAHGKAAEAQAIFEQATAKDGSSLRTRTWILRSWMDQGRINDALGEIDKLAKDNSGRAEIDYLYGMAFFISAKDRIAQGAGGSIVAMNYGDTSRYLQAALKADPQTYTDAYATLAEAAWNTQEFAVARSAAEKACALEPNDIETAWLLAQIAFSQYQQALADDTHKAEADGHAKAVADACNKADQVCAKSTKEEDKLFRGKLHARLGELAEWKQDKAGAAKEYGLALGFDPASADLAGLFGRIGGESFLAAIEEGCAQFTKNWGEANKGDATLLWWLGYARLDQKQYEKSEQAFAAAMKKWPQYYNAWFYTAMARYARQDYDGALAAITRHYDANRDDLVATFLQNRDYNLRVFDFLIGRSATKRDLDAAMLSEVQALAVGDNWNYWNNAGLFYRDAGTPLQRSENEEDRKLAAGDFEKSYGCYQSALALEPNNPALLNDTAVMLHYYLDRDLEKAKEMYRKATERAQIELARKDLKPDLKELYTTALRDSKNNLAKLEKGDKRPN